MTQEPLLLPLVIIALVGLTLLLAALASRYHQQQMMRRAVVQRMQMAIQRLDEGLSRLGRVPVPYEIRQLLRRDVVARYRMIGELARRSSGVDALVADAERRLAAETEQPSAVVPLADDENRLQQWLNGLHDLVDFLNYPGLIQPLPAGAALAYQQRLGDCGADLAARFFIHRYRERLDELAPGRAEAELERLTSYLRTRAPDTAHVRALRQAVLELPDGGADPSSIRVEADDGRRAS